MRKVLYTTDRYKVRERTAAGEKEIPVYIALLSDGSCNNIRLPEDVYREYDGLGQGTRTIKTYFASFEFEKEAEITVSLPPGIQNITIKPKDSIREYCFQSGELRFHVSEENYFVLEPEGDIFGGIHIFCNRHKSPERDREHVIEFTEGIYTADNCKHIHINEYGVPVLDDVADDTLITIADGAVVNAAIELKGVKNVRIAGNGMISLLDRCQGAENSFADDRMWGAFRYHAKPNIYIRSGCKDIEIDGILLNCEFRGIVIRNSENIVIKNVKMFTSTENADGINCYNTSHLLVDHCYIQSADDCFCMYNACDSIPTLFDDGYEDVKAVCMDVEVKNCIMSSNARPVVLGGHATGCINPRGIIENIYIHDCRIIETPYRIYGNTREYSLYWSGFLRLLSQSEQIVRNIRFEDIRIHVTKGHNGKPIHIEVRGENASYTECRGYRIENITFKNITIDGHTEQLLPALISCRDGESEEDNCGISDVTFENVMIGRRKLAKDDIMIKGKCDHIRYL